MSHSLQRQLKHVLPLPWPSGDTRVLHLHGPSPRKPFRFVLIACRVKTRCGRTEYFEVKVGLHQGSALSPLLSIIIMDVLADEARTKPPWAILFADDLVLVSETVEEVEEELERWRAVIENKGLRIIRSKTEYLVPF